MKYKKVLVIMSVLAMLAGVMGCKEKEAPKEEPVKQETVQKQEKPEEQEETNAVEGAEVEQEAQEVPANENLLTGLGDLSEGAIGKRPVAVMVNNVEKAMPQYGVGQADLIFEIPVEGDATRFMAMYGDYTKVPKVCPIRSCRYYFPALSQGFDAFYVNWGIDDTIAEYLEALDLDQIEGITNTGGLFGRDQDKLNQGYALEHTGFFDGTKLASYIEAQGLRTDLKEDKKGAAFQFYGMEEQVKPEGQDCTQVDIDFGAQSSLPMMLRNRYILKISMVLPRLTEKQESSWHSPMYLYWKLRFQYVMKSDTKNWIGMGQAMQKAIMFLMVEYRRLPGPRKKTMKIKTGWRERRKCNEK